MTTVEQVLIVEDHPDAAQVLAQVAAKTFDNPRIEIASTVAGGMEWLAKDVFDIALIDIGLPDGSGIELVRQLATHSPATFTVVTTIFDDESNLFNALRAGACGYLLKGHSAEELAVYLQEAVMGHPPLSPNIAQSVLGYFRQESDQGKSDEHSLAAGVLTGREIEILRLIAKGYQVKEVSRLLGIAQNTAAVHIKNIYRKLNVRNRAEATAAAFDLQLYQPI